MAWEDVSLSELLHENTKNRLYLRLRGRANEIHTAPFVLRLVQSSARTYPHAPRVPLPRPEGDLPMTLVQAITRRRSRRDFSPEPVRAQQLGWLLWLGCGIEQVVTYLGYRAYLRTAPSAGNLGSVDIYPLVLRAEDVPPGLYHYNALEHVLELLVPGDLRQVLVERLVLQPDVAGCAVFLPLAVAIGRERAKYGDRGYRYVFLDAGHVGQNLYLAATALGLACTGFGGFVDDELNRLIGLDGQDEAVAYALAVGVPLAGSKGDGGASEAAEGGSAPGDGGTGTA